MKKKKHLFTVLLLAISLFSTSIPVYAQGNGNADNENSTNEESFEEADRNLMKDLLPGDLDLVELSNKELEDYEILTRRRRSDGTVRPPFDVKGTVKGVLGGILGLVIGSAIFVAFIMMSDLVGWIGGVIMSAAVISLYTVFSKKLRTIDCILTAILTFAGWVLSNGFAYLFQIFLKEQEAGTVVNIFGILDNLAKYSMQYTELSGNMLNRLIVTFIFVVAGAIGSYIFYYKHHSKDMY